MTQFHVRRIQPLVAVLLIGLTLLSATVVAQSAKVEGLIKARNGDTMVLQTSNTPNLSSC